VLVCQCISRSFVVFLKLWKEMAGTLVQSDSTQAMVSLVSAYGDEENEDDSVLDTSGVSAQPEAEPEAASSLDARTEPPGAHFISDDEEPHRSPQYGDTVKPEQNTKLSENQPVTVAATNKCEICLYSVTFYCILVVS